MEKDYAAISDAQDARATELFRGHPDAMRAHRAIMQAAQEPRALDAKTTELMALAIALPSAAKAAWSTTPNNRSRKARHATKSSTLSP